MFPLSGMVAILQNLEKEGGTGCWVHITIDCKEQQQVFTDEEVLWQIKIPRGQKMPRLEDFTLGLWQYSEENIYI